MGFLQIVSNLFKPFDPRRNAGLRASELLNAQLSPSQRAQFKATGWFEVTGCDTGRRYAVRNINFINIDQLDSLGVCVKRWCFAPKGNLAQGDVLLAQKLALECFESEALSLAKDYTPDSKALSGWTERRILLREAGG